MVKRAGSEKERIKRAHSPQNKKKEGKKRTKQEKRGEWKYRRPLDDIVSVLAFIEIANKTEIRNESIFASEKGNIVINFICMYGSKSPSESKRPLTSTTIKAYPALVYGTTSEAAITKKPSNYIHIIKSRSGIDPRAEAAKEKGNGRREYDRSTSSKSFSNDLLPNIQSIHSNILTYLMPHCLFGGCGAEAYHTCAFGQRPRTETDSDRNLERLVQEKRKLKKMGECRTVFNAGVRRAKNQDGDGRGGGVREIEVGAEVNTVAHRNAHNLLLHDDLLVILIFGLANLLFSHCGM